jgi:2-oxoacid:acceptor oxidoreductase delta subunit (pyruvate/2-ketoisovalerate family)
VQRCDVLVGISPSPPPQEVLAAVKPGGLVVLNSESRLPVAGPFGVARTPASRIAQANGVLSAEGRPMGNVALLGACTKLLIPDGLEFLEQAIASRMGARADANIAAAREGFTQCRRQHALAGDVPFARAAGAASRERRSPPVFAVSTTDSRGNHTGTWSLDRPRLMDGCTACGVCALFCPEGAITRDGGTIAVDYLYCKGCGICEVVCPVRNAIVMEAVPA